MLRGVKKPHLKGWRATQGGIYRLKKFICVCFALVARLQVHADNGCLRSHQVAQVDRSNRLNDSRLPKQATAAHSKLVDNAKPDTTLLGLYFQQPAKGMRPFLKYDNPALRVKPQSQVLHDCRLADTGRAGDMQNAMLFQAPHRLG